MASTFYRRQFRARFRLYWRASRRFVVYKILHADDPPYRLAMGLAIGMFVTFTPTVGLQMVFSALISWIFRANKAVGVPLVWISNPITIPFIFGFNYWVGALVLNEPFDMDWMSGVDKLTWLGKVEFYFVKIWGIAAPLWVGSLIVALLIAIPTYFLSHWLICRYRMLRWGQLIPPGPGDPMTVEAEQAEISRGPSKRD